MAAGAGATCGAAAGVETEDEDEAVPVPVPVALPVDGLVILSLALNLTRADLMKLSLDDSEAGIFADEAATCAGTCTATFEGGEGGAMV